MRLEPGEQPYCKFCYKQLPSDWRDFDMCPSCHVKQLVREQTRPRCHLPSYRSPLLALDRKPNG